jgi:hypothetical protein
MLTPFPRCSLWAGLPLRGGARLGRALRERRRRRRTASLAHAELELLRLGRALGVDGLGLAVALLRHVAVPAVCGRVAGFELDLDAAAAGGALLGDLLAVRFLDVRALCFLLLAFGGVVFGVGVARVVTQVLHRADAFRFGLGDWAVALRAGGWRAHAAAQRGVPVDARDLSHGGARALAAADAQAFVEVVRETGDEETALALGACVPRNVAGGLATGVELDLLALRPVAGVHIRVLRPRRAHALLVCLLLLLLEQLALLLALGHVCRERIPVHVVPRALHPRIQHAVLARQVWLLHALAHDGVHQPRQLAVRAYDLGRRLERVALEEDAAVLVQRSVGLGGRQGRLRLRTLLRGRLDVGQGEGLG